MHPQANATSPPPPTDPHLGAAWQRLLHRWFVEYNPLYLLSAMLVLGGMILLSRGLAHDGSLYGQIGVAAIAEIYSVVLIGGAALLMRVGHRRSAVMLALLTVVYQCDLTLHTETCPNLGWVGALATNVWIALFIAKLVALAWAMKLRLSRQIFATATLGALGLAILPYVLQRVAVENARVSSALVMLWLFALAALYRSSTWGTAIVTSTVDLDSWGLTVLRRSARATWVLWGFLLSLHVLFWSTEHPQLLGLRMLAPVVPLVATQWIRRESRVWCVIVATLAFVGLLVPAAFSVSALVAAAALCLRAVTAARSSSFQTVQTPLAPPPATPYRVSSLDEEEERPRTPEGFIASVTLITPEGPQAARRLFIGAGFALYLAVWTLAWSGGPWPAHIMALDVALCAAVLFAAWRLRARIALVPLGAALVHFAVKAQLVPAPQSLLQWGGVSVGLGFILLIASVGVSYRLRPDRPQGPCLKDETEEDRVTSADAMP